MSRLLRRFVPKTLKKKYFCNRCPHYYFDKRKMQEHKIECMKVIDYAIKLPTQKEKELKFKNY